MKKYNYLIILVILIFSFFSCEKDIDINIKDPERILVVDAVITTDNIQHIIKLSENVEYFGEGKVENATGASVKLTGNNQQIQFLELTPGIYTAENAFAAKRGIEYTLNISWNGKQYDAKSILQAEKFLIDTIYVFPDEDDGLNIDGEDEDSLLRSFTAYIFGEEPNPTYHHYAAEIQRNNKSFDFNEIWVFDDYYFNNTYVYGFPILSFNCNKYQDSVSLCFYPVDEKYKDYIGEIQSNVNASFDPFFSPVPPPIHGNISNGGLGYFMVTEYYMVEFKWDHTDLE